MKHSVIDPLVEPSKADASKLIMDVFFEYLCVSLCGSLCYSCYTKLHKEKHKEKKILCNIFTSIYKLDVFVLLNHRTTKPISVKTVFSPKI